MIFTFVVIFIICFCLVRLLPISQAAGPGKDPENFYLRMVALGRMQVDKTSATGYSEVPVIQQFWAFIKNLFAPATYIDSEGVTQTLSRWGYSYSESKAMPPDELLWERVPPTILLNVYSMIVSVPIGIGLGIFMALQKNKWPDHVLSVVVMLVISVPSFIYAFLLQYLFCYVFDWPYSTIANGTNWLSPEMFVSMILPILSMSFGSIAGYARYTRAELTEVLTSDFMLLARTKGLSRAQATVRHAFRNSLVPIFPMLLGEILGLLSGSMIIEKIFAVPGVGALYLTSILMRDYDLFQFLSMFYISIGLVGGLIVDISYGIVDPRIRMGGGKQ